MAFKQRNSSICKYLQASVGASCGQSAIGHSWITCESQFSWDIKYQCGRILDKTKHELMIIYSLPSTSALVQWYVSIAPLTRLSWCTLAEYSATAKRISSAVLGVVCFLQANSVLVLGCIMGWLSIGTGSEDLWVQGWGKNVVLQRHLLPFGMYLIMVGHVDNTDMSKTHVAFLPWYNRLIFSNTLYKYVDGHVCRFKRLWHVKPVMVGHGTLTWRTSPNSEYLAVQPLCNLLPYATPFRCSQVNTSIKINVCK